MPFPTSLVGATTEALTTAVDLRATAEHAAGLGDANPAYLDTTRPDGVVAHPLFPVTVEWPAVLAAGRLAPGELTADERRGGLHVTHDLTVHRPVRPGDELTTIARVTSIAEHRAGALQVLTLQSTDRLGEPVATTAFGMLFPGVGVTARDRPPDPVPRSEATAPTEPVHRITHHLPRTAAHVYTACSRIHNPIHTDPAVARAAGLRDIVLHGTATLGLAVSAVVDQVAGGDPGRVRRVRARFGAVVELPSTIEVVVGAPVPRPAGADGPAGWRVGVEVRTADGALAVRAASVDLHPADEG